MSNDLRNPLAEKIHGDHMEFDNDDDGGKDARNRRWNDDIEDST